MDSGARQVETAVELDAEAMLWRYDDMVVQVQAQVLQRRVDTPGEFPVRK
jgi:hypothetical protein